jgi:hypothetical protein
MKKPRGEESRQFSMTTEPKLKYKSKSLSIYKIFDRFLNYFFLHFSIYISIEKSNTLLVLRFDFAADILQNRVPFGLREQMGRHWKKSWRKPF